MMVEMDAREVAFFGKITAAFTHEMKNVLAIIKESAGLMEDLLSLGQDATFPHRERFVRALGTMEAQAKRGIELTNRLNRFAHSPDEASTTVDLNDMLEQIILLAERFARLRGVTLSLVPYAEALPVTASPVALQMAVFSCLEYCWGVMGEGGKVALSAGQKGQEVIISFVCQSSADVAEDFAGRSFGFEGHPDLEKTAKSLNCRIECSPSQASFDLILPAAFKVKASGRNTHVQVQSPPR
jgi:C4-dicarboxylate-specific signal transduction histidine kinase